MKFIRYAKYTGEPADAIDLEELVKRLGDFFLQALRIAILRVSRWRPSAPWKLSAKPSSAPSRKRPAPRKRHVRRAREMLNDPSA